MRTLMTKIVKKMYHVTLFHMGRLLDVYAEEYEVFKGVCPTPSA